MVHGGGAALLDQQAELGAIHCFCLRLLVQAEQDYPRRWIEVTPQGIRNALY